MTNQLPTRLHHTAYVTKDLEKTRAFYEDVLGIPLVATWCETDFLFGADRTYCHCFFGLADGSALAFFQFADPEDQKLFDPDLAPSPFRHIALHVDQATQDQMAARIEAAGYEEPATFVLEHGYCRSLYITDPNGMILEFTCDAVGADKINADRLQDAHSELKRWLAGDHTTNNTYRHEDAEAAE
ncbi:MAG TPA: VOC family protein [Allosphingosinicella sp.]|nr:VOC family protein [Allosphingosinicella sp.]